MPLTRNPVVIAAEQSGSHPSCPVPAAVLKVAEAALDLALQVTPPFDSNPAREKKQIYLTNLLWNVDLPKLT